jgi:hypothetical protein
VVVQAAWHCATTRARHAAKAFVTPHCCCDRVVQAGKLQAPPSGAGVLRFTTGSGRRARRFRAGLRWRLFRGSARATRRLAAGRGTRALAAGRATRLFAVFFAREDNKKKKDKEPPGPTFRTRDTTVSTTRLRRGHTQKKAHKKEQNSLHLLQSNVSTTISTTPHQRVLQTAPFVSTRARSASEACVSLSLFFFFSTLLGHAAPNHLLPNTQDVPLKWATTPCLPFVFELHSRGRSTHQLNAQKSDTGRGARA